jgi:hypothetical protein
MRPFVSLAIVGLLIARVAAFDGSTVRVEHSKSLPRGQGLGTRGYAPTDAEKAAIKTGNRPSLVRAAIMPRS